jgi:hypothetical protein
MIDLHSIKKNKINLSDYDYKQDIRYRLFFSTISKQEMEVLEEILFSALKFPIADISRNLEMKIDEVKKILEKIKDLSLISIENDHVIVNKELRKYFDGEIQKFDERFAPGMEFIQSLLKKVPIQVLPTWYLIPRTADNIFDSLVEKIFLTPQIYQRHLHEVKPVDGVEAKIYNALFSSEDLKLYLKDLESTFSLTKEQLHEIILEFEFNFIACLSYELQDEEYLEVLTPFHEWKEFLVFAKNHLPKPISPSNGIELFRQEEYAFILDLFSLLSAIKEQPLSIESKLGKPVIKESLLESICKTLKGFEIKKETKQEILLYVQQLIQKAISIGLASLQNNELKAQKTFDEWSALDIERKAHFIYKHPNNSFLNPNCPQELVQEKNIREIEKSLSKLSQSDWVYFDDFLKGCIAAIGDNGKVELKKTGKSWKYTLPDYTEKEKLFIQIALLEWLFESGIVQTGIHKCRPCFRLTSLGRKMFN